MICRMSISNLQTNFHLKLIELSANPAGFGASELTGYSPEQVRRAAEALVKAGKIVRAKTASQRVRYFANDALARAHIAGQAPARATHAAAGSRAKANWTPDAPMHITPRTRIYIAPPLPRDVFRTNTYPQF
ncbi:MAG TPA: hypothetical protein PLG77_04315 [Burkholderiaceae bacterium]|nr:hypothetical protein [Burkholderiaceae bacterium]